MTQQPNFTATETPQDIAVGLAPGDYIAQVRWFPIPQVAVIYATAPAAPADADDYFQCEAGRAFLFSVGRGHRADLGSSGAVDPGGRRARYARCSRGDCTDRGMTIQTARPAELRISEPTPTLPITPAPTPITAAELAAEIGTDETRAGHLLAAVWPRVDQYAPTAPTGVQREAVIRFSGWLLEAPSGGVRSESTGDVATSFSPSMTGGFRASGAAALLAPWRVRRAGAIG